MIQQSPTEERASIVRAIETEIDRQVDLGAGMAATCGVTGLLAVNADLDMDALASAILASQAAQPAEADGVERPALPAEAIHAPDCEHPRAPIWMCKCPRPVFPATPKAPTSTAGEVEDAFRAGWDARELKDSGPSAAGYCDDSYNADLAWSLYDKPLANPPAPNDDLRAAIAAALPGITSMVEHLERWQETGAVAGPDESWLLYEGLRASLSALKENRRG